MGFLGLMTVGVSIAVLAVAASCSSGMIINGLYGSAVEFRLDLNPGVACLRLVRVVLLFVVLVVTLGESSRRILIVGAEVLASSGDSVTVGSEFETGSRLSALAKDWDCDDGD